MISRKKIEDKVDTMKYIKRLIVLVCLLLVTGCAKQEPDYIEVTTADTVFENRFYYGSLPEEEQLIYREIYQGIIELQEKIIVHGDSPYVVNDIMSLIMNDSPELFWIDGSAQATTYDDPSFTEAYTVIEPNYLYAQDEKELKEAEIEKVVTEILNSIPADFGEYEKMKCVYEYLLDSITYVEGAPDSQNIYSSLVLKESVCAGYAKANQILLNRLGFFCTYVTGDATNEDGISSHAWNIVKCNGNYYYTDVTWADPAESEGHSDFVSSTIYDYLCCSAYELEDTHELDEGYDYPECISEDLNYYRVNQMYYETLDGEQLLDKMKASIDNKEVCVTFKFDKGIYEDGKNIIQNELAEKAAKYLCSTYGLRKVNYMMEENESINRITVYWKYE